MIRTQGIVSGNVGCELQDKAGNIWFRTSGEGVYRYDGKSFTNFTTKDGLSSNDVRKIIEDRAGTILLATNSSICKYNPSALLRPGSKLFSPYTETADLNKLSITSLLEDKEGNLWFGTINNGVYRYDGRSFTNFLNNDDYPFNLGNHNQLILSILQDKNGYIWFCSWNGGGVWRYDPLASLKTGSKPFKNYLPSADYYRQNEDGRSKAGQSFATYLPKFVNTQPQETIPDDMIFSVSEDKVGNLWFATRRHGACRYDGKTFTSFRENEGFTSRGIYAIVEDKKGIIWLATEDTGVWRYDPEAALKTGTKQFKNFTTKDGLVNNSVFSILEDRKGNLWFGTRGFGLSRFDGKTFTTFSE